MNRRTAPRSNVTPLHRPIPRLEPGDLLSLATASALTGMSHEFLRERCERGEIEAAKLGRAWRIKRTALEAYVAQNTRGGQ